MMIDYRHLSEKESLTVKGRSCYDETRSTL
jgi:hypothetical protein